MKPYDTDRSLINTRPAYLTDFLFSVANTSTQSQIRGEELQTFVPVWLNPGGTNTVYLALQLGADQTNLCSAAAATLLLYGGLDLNGHIITVDGAGYSHLGGIGAITGAGGVVKTGLGRLRFGALGPNTYSGATKTAGR